MRSAAAARLLLAASAASAAVQGARAAATGRCDLEADCTFNANVNGKTYTWDFRGLCNPLEDYTITDVQKHTYYAQICGEAAQNCLPGEWQSQYEYGHVVQTWASAPTCASPPACVEERTGEPACCTAPCEVVAVQAAQFSLLNPSDPGGGLQISYIGETPTATDNHLCGFDPNTGQRFPRVTRMQFFCDEDQTGFAALYEADQDAADSCLYTLKFRTSLACADAGMSGGWIFVTIVLVLFAVYAGAGAAWGYHKTRTWAFPHAEFWREANELIFEGVAFTFSGFKKPVKGIMAGSKYQGIGSDGADPAAAADEPAFTGSSGSGSGSGGGYQGKPEYTNL